MTGGRKWVLCPTDTDVREVKEAIAEAQARVVKGANGAQLSLYFWMGHYVNERVRSDGWGNGTIDALSERLRRDMPGLRGFSAKNIRTMRQFYAAWNPVLAIWPPAAAKSDGSGGKRVPKAENGLPCPPAAALALLEKVPPGVKDFPWEAFLSIGFSHHMDILAKAKTLEERLFYIESAWREIWDRRTLRMRLARNEWAHRGRMPSNFAVSMRKPGMAARAVRAFKDEYLLDFVNMEDLGAGSPEDVDERVLESAIVANVRRFILEAGRDFSFLGNQYPLEAAGREFFVDLLFFNRSLNALVAFELKKGPFKPAYLGQLHLYLQILDDTVRKPHENPPVGVILCQEADRTFVEYAVRDYSQPMGVAVYRTADEMPEPLRKALPPIEKWDGVLPGKDSAGILAARGGQIGEPVNRAGKKTKGKKGQTTRLPTGKLAQGRGERGSTKGRKGERRGGEGVAGGAATGGTRMGGANDLRCNESTTPMNEVTG